MENLKLTKEQLENFPEKKLTKEELINLNKKNEHFDRTVRQFCFHVLKSELQANVTIHIKVDEIDSFFENSDYEKCYASAGLFDRIANKLRLDFRKDPYVLIDTCFCIKGDKYDTIIVDGFLDFIKSIDAKQR